MDSEYPPLPSSKAEVSLSDGEAGALASSGLESPVLLTNGPSPNSTGQSNTQVIVDGGDIILEYVTSRHAARGTSCWRVSSESLVQSSPYFRVLLDPTKFSEGRHLMRQRELYGGATGPSGFDPERDALPTVRLPDNHLPPRLGPDTIGFFLRVLSVNSFNEEEKESFAAEVRSQRPSFVAAVVELADAFNSPEVVRDTLKHSGYSLAKPKLPLTKFNTSMLKMNEDRIRQSIFIAKFMGDRTIFQMLTHALIVAGSKYWVNGVESPEPDTPSWHYFSDGLEDELYYRRQSVLNTITDLQAHFLRIYGAFEGPAPPKPGIPNASSSGFRPNQPQSQYQCRCGLGNSSACDAFHLGQMTRFFALRTKTIFIGSTLINPDFDPDIEDPASEAEFDAQSGLSPPPTDITSVISSLKQCPDYQIDSNHIACGIRRRFLPSLDCIDGFVGDERGLLGVNLINWRGDGSARKWPRIQGSWANRSHRRALVMDLRLSKISGVPVMSPGGSGAQFREEDARLLFTAKKRNWES
ncbi:hypothetical protein BDV12DRAFT_159745 [Aspergillus spectabilis]